MIRLIQRLNVFRGSSLLSVKTALTRARDALKDARTFRKLIREYERENPSTGKEPNLYAQSFPAQHTSARGSNPRAFERLRVAASYFGRRVSRDLHRRVRQSVRPAGAVHRFVSPSDIEQLSCSAVFKKRASLSA